MTSIAHCYKGKTKEDFFLCLSVFTNYITASSLVAQVYRTSVHILLLVAQVFNQNSDLI